MRRLVVFDGECGFCSSVVRFATRWRLVEAEFVPWQLADLATLGLTERACVEAVQYCRMDGQITTGGRAVTAALRDGRWPWSWAGRLAELPGLRRVVDHAYLLVSANRYRLPGGTPACGTEPR